MDNKERDAIGKYLQLARQERGYSQTELAKLAGVSQSLLSQVEAGKKDLPRQAITRLVKQHGFDARRLAGDSSALAAHRESLLGWAAYERARSTHKSLCRTVDYLAHALKPHASYLAARITDADGRRALDDLLSPGFEASQYWRVPPQDEMREVLQRDEDVSLQNEGERLIRLFEALGPDDRRLVFSLLQRLSGAANGRSSGSAPAGGVA